MFPKDSFPRKQATAIVGFFPLRPGRHLGPSGTEEYEEINILSDFFQVPVCFVFTLFF